MTISFDDSKYSIAHAKRHIAELERQIAAFFKTKPYAYVIETDAHTGEKIHKYKLVKPMPVDLKGIASDAFINLRNSLDQLTFALGGRGAYFPIADDATKFEDGVKGRCKTLPKEITALVRSFKPYKGGDDLLWALNAISNANKHGIITPVALQGGAIHFKRFSGVGGGPRIKAPFWDRTKNEMELFRINAQSNVEADLNITTHIALCNIEFVDGQPVDAILNLLTDKVEGILMAIEAEAKRLGLVT